jgi:hypothetical protein
MFRFTIRELALLTLCVAIAVSWWVDRRQLSLRADEATKKASEFEWWYRDAFDHLVSLDIAIRREGFSSSRKTGSKKVTLHKLDGYAP